MLVCADAPYADLKWNTPAEGSVRASEPGAPTESDEPASAAGTVGWSETAGAAAGKSGKAVVHKKEKASAVARPALGSAPETHALPDPAALKALLDRDFHEAHAAVDKLCTVIDLHNSITENALQSGWTVHVRYAAVVLLLQAVLSILPCVQRRLQDRRDDYSNRLPLVYGRG